PPFSMREDGPTGSHLIDRLRERAPDGGVEGVYGQADVFHRNRGAYRGGFSMLETDRIPADWVAHCNAMDEVWVPSRMNEQAFRESGVTRPLHVMPLGYDPAYFHPQIESHREASRFTFLSIFEWGERKAPEVLLRAFTDEFSANEDVAL